MGDDDDYDYEDEYDAFRDEYAVRERTEYFDGGGLALHRNKGDIIKDPLQRFYIYVDAIVRQLKQTKVIDITANEIAVIVNAIPNLKNANYKNPTAFVLGYTVSRKGIIDLSAVRGKLSSLENPVREIDVIRYANLWRRLRML
jgi:hypothetical protein